MLDRSRKIMAKLRRVIDTPNSEKTHIEFNKVLPASLGHILERVDRVCTVDNGVIYRADCVSYVL